MEWDRKAFGRRLFQARQERGLQLGRDVPKAEVARLVGVTDTAVGSWEKGAKPPRVETIVRLAAALGVNASWLAFGEEAQEVRPRRKTAAEIDAEMIQEPDPRPLIERGHGRHGKTG